MAEIRVSDIQGIISYTIIELRRLYKNMRFMSYHMKCSYIEILVQYMFALYARVKVDYTKETVKVVAKNIIASYDAKGDNLELRRFVSMLCEVRNEVAHARQLPKTISLVEELWSSDTFNELLHILYIDIEETPVKVNPMFNPAEIMAGE